MSAGSSGNGHRFKIISPSIVQGAFWGVFRGSNTKKSGENGKTAGPIGPKLYAHNYADGSGNGHRLNNIGPVRYQGKHFNQGLSRSNILGFSPLGGQHFIKLKIWISAENKCTFVL